jgi:hypothetical protein
MLGIATEHSAIAATMRENLATRRCIFCSLTRMAAAPHRLLDRYNRDEDRTEPAILRAIAIVMASSAGSGVGVDP